METKPTWQIESKTVSVAGNKEQSALKKWKFVIKTEMLEAPIRSVSVEQDFPVLSGLSDLGKRIPNFPILTKGHEPEAFYFSADAVS